MQDTLVVIKPDGVKRNLIGKIISYYEAEGLIVKKLQMMTASKELLAKHYPEDDDYLITIGKKSEKSGDKITNYKEHGRMIVTGLRDYLTEGSVVAMVITGENAIKNVRRITGYTDPTAAAKGTIRGDLGNDSIQAANAEKRPCRNLVHASGNEEEAAAEIKLWFG